MLTLLLSAVVVALAMVHPALGLGFFVVAAIWLHSRKRAGRLAAIGASGWTRPAITSAMKQEVWTRDGGRCVICGTDRELEYDHDVPFARGGATTVANLRLVCRYHNRSKGAKIA